jgi:hypothetical protein
VQDAGAEEGLLTKLGRWIDGMNEKLAEVGGKSDDVGKN